MKTKALVCFTVMKLLCTFVFAYVIFVVISILMSMVCKMFGSEFHNINKCIAQDIRSDLCLFILICLKKKLCNEDFHLILGLITGVSQVEM